MKNTYQFCFSLWLIALSAVLIGSLYPIDKLPEGTPEISDKVLHLAAYFSIAWLALLASKTGARMTIYVLISFFFGIIIEFLQPITGRAFEFADMAANASGIVIAIIIHQIYFRVIARK
jgi:VanZ family protein